MDTLKSLNQEKNALLEKKRAAITAVWSIAEKVEPRLAQHLREAVHEWYQSDINMLEWKFDYIEQNMASKIPFSSGATCQHGVPTNLACAQCGDEQE